MSDPSMGGLGQVKHIIAVASGKGGVGKSTTTTNLALSLAKQYKVGILDADIYGPSQGLMLGINSGTRPETMGEKNFTPIQVHGIKVMSMAFLIEEDTPMVWRGPMAAGALQQMLLQTHWGELDYLFVDMPPGTGDIQLTLSQKAKLSGAIIVTTPQDLALLDARKGIAMFTKVEVPVLGIVENMATHICSQCGLQEAIFGSGGGQKLAAETHTQVLASLPLDINIRQQMETGTPNVVADVNSPVTKAYADLAQALVNRVNNHISQSGAPSISIED